MDGKLDADCTWYVAAAQECRLYMCGRSRRLYMCGRSRGRSHEVKGHSEGEDAGQGAGKGGAGGAARYGTV